MIPYELIDDEIELFGAVLSDCCELPVDSPLEDTKKKWCEDVKAPYKDDIVIVGMWGDPYQDKLFSNVGMGGPPPRQAFADVDLSTAIYLG